MGHSSRQAILDAALDCASDVGWHAATMTAIRERAGVSNGSMFHFFPTRAALTAEVLRTGLRAHQSTQLAVLTSSRSARAGVRRFVLEHLAWVEANRPLAELLLLTPPGELAASLGKHGVGENEVWVEAVGLWLARHGWVAPPALDLVMAAWLGPCHEHARRWLGGRADELSASADFLADTAWAGLSPLLATRRRPR